MKKLKIFAINIICLSILFAFTGCGNDDEVVETDNNYVEKSMSDESFSELQTNYAATVDAYNAVKELYENDEVEQNDDIEGVINEAAAIINEMGELDQNDLSESDVEALNQSMLNIVNSLTVVGNSLVDQLNGMCTVETFEMLQGNYSVMVDVYNSVKENAPDDETIQEVITQAGEIITEMGEIDKSTLTEQAAQELNDNIVSIVETLTTLVN